MKDTANTNDISQDTVHQLEELLDDYSDKVAKLFESITNNFPDYPELNTAVCPSIYVSAPSETAVQSSKGIVPANWVKLPGMQGCQLIAGQPPQDPVMNNFWMSVWENNIYNIIDLRGTSEYEYPDFNIKKYWPSRSGESLILDSCSVSHESTATKRYHDLAFVHHKFILFNKQLGMKRVINRFEYHDWVDLKTIPCPSLLLFCHWIHKIQETSSKDSNIYIHCRGGVGRTGVLIASYFTYYQIRHNILHRDNIVEGLLRTIEQCRQCRGRLFICNPTQLESIVLLSRFLISGSI